MEDLLLAHVLHSSDCPHGAGPVELDDVLDAITVAGEPVEQQRVMTRAVSRVPAARRRSREPLQSVRLSASRGGRAGGEGC